MRTRTMKNMTEKQTTVRIEFYISFDSEGSPVGPVNTVSLLSSSNANIGETGTDGFGVGLLLPQRLVPNQSLSE